MRGAKVLFSGFHARVVLRPQAGIESIDPTTLVSLGAVGQQRGLLRIGGKALLILFDRLIIIGWLGIQSFIAQLECASYYNVSLFSLLVCCYNFFILPSQLFPLCFVCGALAPSGWRCSAATAHRRFDLIQRKAAAIARRKR